MATKFITVITDEAMQKICYEGGGWTITPYQFKVSDTDILEGVQVLDGSGNVTDEAMEKLLAFNTAKMEEDRTAPGNHVWCEKPFQSIRKANENTLSHHVVIPPDLEYSSKTIKVIYFIYKAENEDPFLYGLAYALEDIIYEAGITQSFFFTFTVANSKTVQDIEYVINYTYPDEISDHNTSPDVHDNLLKRDGTRSITGTLQYSGDREFDSDFQLVSKRYVDMLIAELKANNNLR